MSTLYGRVGGLLRARSALSRVLLLLRLRRSRRARGLRAAAGCLALSRGPSFLAARRAPDRLPSRAHLGKLLRAVGVHAALLLERPLRLARA